ncbi:amino acid adenylation domain-containing protein [Amycolatopsis magusensis]|uniref:non-ribosomal peptide synthetase family protein n=1 Tax=Amycolatopsis magusensis TaxID=882444 RepID=UPI0024A8C0FE|nr:amino acid adenylation domain-containing protein [Amycolatopsis magusensis]MDI5978871.1 amino acid adenylation domain-containing protein [Amycolatopsis magusensis]
MPVGREEVHNLSAEEKRGLLAELLARDPGRDIAKLSLLQRRLWVLRRMEPTIRTHVLGLFEADGELDLEVLQTAVRAVVNRHPLLCAGFVEVEGQPVRVESREVWVNVPLVDLSGLSTAHQDEEILLLAEREVSQVFDVSTPPLVRVSVARCSAGNHVLIVVGHQLVADQASVSLFAGEVARCYGELLRETAPASAATATFAEFVEAQREWLDSAEATAQLAFWRDRLAGAPVLAVPADRPAASDRVRTLAGSSRSWNVDRPLADRWAALPAEDSDIVLAVWLVVLSRYTGQRDVVLGLPLPNRSKAEWGPVIGPFENTVALRVELDGGASFSELLSRVRHARDEATRRGQLPFERVVEELQPPAEVGQAPLFPVRFVDEEPMPPVSEQGIDWRPRYTGAGLAPFELTLRLIPGAGEPVVRLEFATELFDAATAERMLAHVRVVAEAASREPDLPLSSLPMLTAPEEHVILGAWAGTTSEWQGGLCVHQMVEHQAGRTPEVTAVVSGEDRLSYGELNDRANGLAHHLRAIGVRPEERVGVEAGRGVATVVGLLAVLKAGAAYVPLDPDHPRERLLFVLEDSGIGVVLIGDGHADRLPLGDRTVIRLDHLAPGGPAGNPEPAADPDGLAYVIYTSGSTGTPKGVLTSHRSVAHATAIRSQALSAHVPQAGSSYLMLAPFTFDASAAGLYWTLSSGGRLILPDNADVQDPRLLARLLSHHQVTHLDGVPSQYAMLLEVQPLAVRDLRFCLLAGETLSPALVRRHHHLAPEAPLYNEYGPTEATVWSTIFACPEDFEGGSVPIGKPIPNVRAYLLDSEFNPVPAGVPGEIHLAGPGLARGYLNHPELTADKFVPNPFGVAGDRLYRTGDLAGWLPDGSLDFLGRTDTQVKVRGFRIELGEIETALQNHVGIASAVVTVRQDTPEDTRLVAYVITRSEGVSREDLNTHLLRSLPSHMLPNIFVFLDKLPLTPHGKVDRQALPAPEVHDQRTAPYEAPHTKVEREVAQAFAEALGVDRMGRHDDFFELGGNSLLIAKVGAILAGLYGVDLPLPLLFTQPTVEGVAATIELFWSGGYQGLQDSRDPTTMLAEIVLEEGIRPDGLPMADIHHPRGIFLTGATGYFGIFVLEQLMRETTADVYCLTRASSPDNGLDRLRRTAETFKVDWTQEFDDRVKAVVGDMAERRFGMSTAAFDELAVKVDSIYHNAALVNFVWPYSVLKGPNVGGTVEVLRLACTKQVKVVHFVSTIDVLVGSHMPRPFVEDPLPQLPPHVPFSYPQTKWISEKIVELAKDRGVPTTIFRPSIMMGHTETGACHQTDYILVGLRGFLELGILPHYDEVLNCTTADYASKAFVHLTLQEDSIGQIFHLWNTDAIPTMATYEWVRTFGYEFEVVSFSEAVDRARRVDPSHPIYPLLPVLFLYESGEAGLPMTWDDHLKLDPLLECAHTLKALEGSGIEAPAIDEKWMHDCLAFLIERGQLSSPAAVSRFALAD